MTSRNHGRRRVDVLALLAAITVAGCGKARDDVPVPPPTSPPVDPVPTAPAWQTALPISGARDVIERPDGRLVIVADITEADATAQIAGETIGSRGLGAILLLGSGDKTGTSGVLARVLP